MRFNIGNLQQDPSKHGKCNHVMDNLPFLVPCPAWISMHLKLLEDLYDTLLLPAAEMCVLGKTPHYSFYLQQLEEIKADVDVRVQLRWAVMGHYMVTGLELLSHRDRGQRVNQMREQRWSCVMLTLDAKYRAWELCRHTGRKNKGCHHKYLDPLKVGACKVQSTGGGKCFCI